jgi:hypothetical protein
MLQCIWNEFSISIPQIILHVMIEKCLSSNQMADYTAFGTLKFSKTIIRLNVRLTKVLPEVCSLVDWGSWFLSRDSKVSRRGCATQCIVD